MSAPTRPLGLSSEYQFCSNEGRICNLGDGNHSVAFISDDGNVHYRTFSNDKIACTSKSFGGDPDPKVAKSCWSTEIPDYFRFDNGIPIGFHYCSRENSVCVVPDSQESNILYGSGNNFNYVNASQVPCNSQVLGTAGEDGKNACYYQTNQALSHFKTKKPYTNYAAPPPKESFDKIIKDTIIYRQLKNLSNNNTLAWSLFGVILLVITIVLIAVAISTSASYN